MIQQPGQKAGSEEKLRITVKQTGEEYLLDPRFSKTCVLLSSESIQNEWRVSNQHLNWNHLPLFFRLMEAHDFDPSKIQLIKSENKDNWIHSFDPKTQEILGRLDEDFKRTYQILRLAEYLGIRVIEKCVYHKLASYYYPGLTIVSLEEFKSKFNITNPNPVTLERKQKYYEVFESLNNLYVEKAQSKMKFLEEKGATKGFGIQPTRRYY